MAQVSSEDARLRDGPLISIVMPVYRPKAEHLIAAIESVRAQLYVNWELCICDDHSMCENTARILAGYAGSDDRIKVVERAENGHISAASNDALTLCRGEFVALLDQDDVLAPHALLMVALVVLEVPDAGVIYSDEDLIAARDKRVGPYMKSDWNLYLFRSHNMISHLGVYRRSLLSRVGGFRVGYEGSQDYDLALRCIELCNDRQIIHIPQVLYHWRTHDASTAQDIDNKPYVVDAALRALSDHLDRCNISASVEKTPSASYRVRYAAPDMRSEVAVVLCNSLHADIRDMAERALAEHNVQCNLVFITGSRHEVLEILRNSPAEYVYFSDGSQPLSGDWLREMLGIISQDDVGIVGGKQIDEKGDVVHAGYAVDSSGRYLHLHRQVRGHGNAGRAELIQELCAVSSGCMLARRDLFVSLGGFALEYVDSALADIDFCQRARRQGWRVVWTPYALFRAIDCAPLVKDRPREESPSVRSDQHRYIAQWGGVDDGYFSIHLSICEPQLKLDPARSEAKTLCSGWGLGLQSKTE
jgi:glycosyltransferase involved in cell wall biosynthesis